VSETLELPSGDVVTPDDVFRDDGYPYRFVPVESDRYAFEPVPLYWGGGDMDVPFTDRRALVDQWEPEASGVPTESEWATRLADARTDDRFDEAELDALERELLGSEEPDHSATDEGLFATLRGLLGRSG
jgi:hypothetical protein